MHDDLPEVCRGTTAPGIEWRLMAGPSGLTQGDPVWARIAARLPDGRVIDVATSSRGDMAEGGLGEWSLGPEFASLVWGFVDTSVSEAEGFTAAGSAVSLSLVEVAPLECKMLLYVALSRQQRVRTIVLTGVAGASTRITLP